MTSLITGFLVVFVLLAVLLVVVARMRHQTGGGLGPTEFSDGSMTTTPTGYPEEMHGSGKKIGPAENKAAKF
jgi:preprotein translocase subunit SecG